MAQVEAVVVAVEKWLGRIVVAAVEVEVGFH